MKITIGHLYPDLLNLYGDRGNIQCMMKRCQWRGIEAETLEFKLEDEVDFSKLDIVLLGGGSDREQMIVCKRLQQIQKNFKDYVEDGGVVIAVCGGYQLLGDYYQTDEGRMEGLHLVKLHTEQKPGRLISNIVLKSDLFDMPVVGFENHGGRTDIGDNQPFGKVLYGSGNDGESGYEGIVYKHVIGTYLHGPLLPKNPQVCDWLIKKALERKYGKDIELQPLDDQEEKEAVKKQLLQLLDEEYGIEEEDFLSAEIEVVPAGKARDFGLDRSMIMSYGQDDRVCAYTSLAAMLNVEAPKRTSCCILVDKEEIGSVGATGMHSRFFENTVAEILALTGDYNDLRLRRTLQNSYMLSSDVSAAFDPNYPSVMEKKNCAYFGKGLVLNKYTGARGKSGSNDANPEYIAQLRKIFDEAKVAFQTAELGKVDEGGGGTIAYIPAAYSMNVIDCGVAVLSMHAPWEITSKSDIYEVEKGYEAFLKNCR